LTYGSEEPPPCTEQKKKLAMAKRRLRYCEEKVKIVRKWIRSVRAELNEFDGQMARMNNCLDTDIPRAVSALERMLRALEKYVQTSQPSTGGAGSPADKQGGGEKTKDEAKQAPGDDAS
jgi:hypothetical protein